MPLLTPMWMGDVDNAVTYSAQQDRAGVLSSIFSREGVIDTLSGQLKVTQRAAGANMSVDVAPGRCAVYGDDVSDQGAYVCASTTTVNVTVPAKPASGTLTHRLIARVRDKLANGTYTTLDWTIELLADTGTGLKATPNSAISLATIAVSSSATSVTDAMITDTRPVAMVGTPDIAGTWTAISPDYAASDATRPLRWAVSANGWVSLAGWVRFNKADVPIYAGNTYSITTTALPAAIRPSPAGYRDMAGMTSWGAVAYSLNPAGQLTYRTFQSVTLVQNIAWWSFDGVGWKL